jgi:hypothetical protein
MTIKESIPGNNGEAKRQMTQIMALSSSTVLGKSVKDGPATKSDDIFGVLDSKDVVSSGYTTLATALAAVPPGKALVLTAGSNLNLTADTATSVPIIRMGGSITQTRGNSYTLAVNGPCGGLDGQWLVGFLPGQVKGLKYVTPQMFGAKADGVSIDTVAIQAAATCAASSGTALSFPPGTYLTGTIHWNHCDLLGSGRNQTIIRGLPASDIFAAPVPTSKAQINSTTISGITFIVDDSVDATTTFPDRNGVGNAALAFPLHDGANLSPNNRMHVSDLVFQSASGVAQHGSCGIFQQNASYASQFDNILFQALHYGYAEVIPPVNSTTFNGDSDAMKFSRISINWCHVGITVRNSCYQVFENIDAYPHPTKVGSNPIVFNMLSRQNIARNTGYESLFSEFYIEAGPGCTGPLMIIPGAKHKFIKLIIVGPAASSIQINSEASVFEDPYIGVPIVLNGPRNVLKNVSYGANYSLTDNSYGNSVTLGRYDSYPAGKMREWEVNKKRREPFMAQNGAFIQQYGYTNADSPSLQDLFIFPEEMRLYAQPAANHAIRSDASSETGTYLKVYPVNGGAIAFVNGLALKVGNSGTFFARKRYRITTKARVGGGLGPYKYRIMLDYAGSNYGIITDFLTTSWGVYTFDADLSSAVLGATPNIWFNRVSGDNTELHVAWISIRPYPDEILTNQVRWYGGVLWMTGRGSPQGVVSAPVGSLYTRTDGGAGSTLYVKESGIGSSGWAAK